MKRQAIDAYQVKRAIFIQSSIAHIPGCDILLFANIKDKSLDLSVGPPFRVYVLGLCRSHQRRGQLSP